MWGCGDSVPRSSILEAIAEAHNLANAQAQATATATAQAQAAALKLQQQQQAASGSLQSPQPPAAGSAPMQPPTSASGVVLVNPGFWFLSFRGPCVRVRLSACTAAGSVVRKQACAQGC